MESGSVLITGYMCKYMVQILRTSNEYHVTDNFIFLGNKTQQYRQVGNAVPPILGEVLAKQLIRFLNG